MKFAAREWVQRATKVQRARKVIRVTRVIVETKVLRVLVHR
jgi:hypothetical protein